MIEWVYAQETPRRSRPDPRSGPWRLELVVMGAPSKSWAIVVEEGEYENCSVVAVIGPYRARRYAVSALVQAGYELWSDDREEIYRFERRFAEVMSMKGELDAGS